MQADKQIRDLNRSCLRLRDCLAFAPQTHRGETYYHIENTATSKFFRVGYAQYVFISLLDGQTTFSTALALTARQLGADAFGEQDATRLAQWLLRNELATFADESRQGAFTRESASQSPAKLLHKINPFWLKIPLGSPDRVFASALPYVRWLFQPIALLGMLAVCAVGGYLLAVDWDKFSTASGAVFAPSNWIWMLATWGILKVVHEFAHGAACKYFGGFVKDTGLVFILFAPMAYVDVTSTWRFPSKWQRIAVASAGMWVELVIAAIAVIGWSRTESPFVAHLLHNIVLMAGVSTLLFNANPLMRFDGYFILSDLLELPNLYEEGSNRIRQFSSWLFLGKSATRFCTTADRGQSWFLWTYGWAASFWKLVVCASLLIGASVMLRGAGILLCALGVVLWFGLPMRQALRTLSSQYYESRPAFLRAVVVSASLGLCVWGLWSVVPTPATLQVPCIVDYEQAAFVRASAAGFLDEVMVVDGQVVEAGTPLVRMSNDELGVEVNRLISDRKQSEQRTRMARDQHEPVLVQIEHEKQRSIDRELQDKLLQLDSFVVLAPRAGRVVAQGLQHRLGTYIEKGDDLLVVGDDEQKELVISISQDDIQDALPRIGESVQLRIGSRAAMVGKLSRIEPRAGTKLPHEALAATVGGAIAVQQSTNQNSEASNVESSDPRFTGLVTLAKGDATRLFSGERGYAQIGRKSETIGRWAVREAQAFIESRAGLTASAR